MKSTRSSSVLSHPLLIAGLAAIICLFVSSPSPAQVTTSKPSLVPRSLSYRTLLSRLSLTLVGHDLNGVSLNGDIMEDIELKSVRTTESVLKDGTYAELNVVAGAIWGERVTGTRRANRWIAPQQMNGTELTAELNSGQTLPLRIEEVYRGSTGIQRLIHYYIVSYETEDGWSPLCGRNEYDQPIPAIVLKGRWDYAEGTETGGAWIDDDDAFTFGCTGYVLAKCVEGGYLPWMPERICAPWDKSCERGDLQAYHQTCTRMMRADYCGNGVSYTENNMPIHLYDRLGIRVDTLDWNFEAEWDEDGAICIDQSRLFDSSPECAAELEDPSCGDRQHFNEGTLLMSEF